MSVFIPKHKDGRPKSPFYYYSFTLKVDGQSKKFEGSTGQRTRRAAEAVEDRKRQEAALGLLGNSITVEQACDRFWREVGRHAKSEHAGATTRSWLADIVLYYGAETPLLAIGPKEVAAAIEAKRNTPITKRSKTIEGRFPKPGTVNRTVVEGMRRILRRAKSHWELPVDLDRFNWGGRDGLRLKGEQERLRQLSAEEERRLWQHLHPDYADLIELYIISGKRQSIWLGLKRTQFDATAGTVRIPILKKVGGLTWQTLELTPREMEIVSRAVQASGSEHVFTAASRRPSDRGARRPISKQMLTDAWAAAMTDAQISDFRLHDLRHTFASRALASGEVSLKALQHAMDHSDVKSTLRYVHLTDEGKAIHRVRQSVTTSREAQPNVVPIRKKPA